MAIQKKKLKVLYLCGLGGIVLLMAQRMFSPSFSYVDTLSSAVVYPVLVAQRAIVVPVQQFFRRMESHDALEAQLKILQQQNVDFMAENIKLRASLAYYRTVATIADFSERYSSKQAVVAQVLIRNIGPDKHKCVLDKGSRHGVCKDMVAVYKNCLVGKITDVYPLHCELTLITDASCRVSALCVDTQTPGIHVGTNQAHTTLLQRVSHLASIKEADMVVSSGEGLVFPQGFALGRIKTIEPDGLYIKIEIEPQCDIRTIDYCLLIKKGECDALPTLRTMAEDVHETAILTNAR